MKKPFKKKFGPEITVAYKLWGLNIDIVSRQTGQTVMDASNFSISDLKHLVAAAKFALKKRKAGYK